MDIFYLIIVTLDSIKLNTHYLQWNLISLHFYNLAGNFFATTINYCSFHKAWRFSLPFFGKFGAKTFATNLKIFIKFLECPKNNDAAETHFDAPFKIVGSWALRWNSTSRSLFRITNKGKRRKIQYRILFFHHRCRRTFKSSCLSSLDLVLLSTSLLSVQCYDSFCVRWKIIACSDDSRISA